MRILLVSMTSPSDRSFGSAVRSNYLWRALKRLGSVDTLVLVPGEASAREAPREADELARIVFRKPVLPWPTSARREAAALIDQALAGRHYDVVVARYVQLALLVDGCVQAPIVLDADDLSKQVPGQGLGSVARLRERAKLAVREAITRIALPRYAHVWYVNPADAAQFPVRSSSMLPNVIEPAAPPAVLHGLRPPTVLMVGTYGYAPNREGATYFAQQVLPRLRAALPDARLRLVGYVPPDDPLPCSALPGVEVAGFVDNLASQYANADVVVAPVFSGGGTQIKVLEALAYGRGLVASPFALAGFSAYLQDGVHLRIAQSAQDWADQCLALMRDPPAADALGAAGRAVVARHFSLASMEAAVAQTLNGLAPAGAPAAAGS
jgi:glycosyltransferase involved in cell wall biosynthesis